VTIIVNDASVLPGLIRENTAYYLFAPNHAVATIAVVMVIALLIRQYH
jgi:hypothetical protein